MVLPIRRSQNLRDPNQLPDDLNVPPLGGDDDFGGNDDWGPGSGRRPPGPPGPEEPGFEDFQVEIPDWLQRFSEEGYGAGFMRDVLQLGGTPLASKANVMQRQLAENPFLQGVSGSGFAQKQIQSLGVEKSKQLSSLQLGAEQKNLGIQRGALAKLRELERFNEQIERDWRNMNQMERFQAQQRKFQLESALNAYDQQQGPGAGMQFGAFLAQLAPLAL